MYKLKVIVDKNSKSKFEVLRENGTYYYIVQDKNNNITKKPTNWVKEHIDEIINAGLSGNNLYVKKSIVGNKVKYSNFKCLGPFYLRGSSTYKCAILFEVGKDIVYLDDYPISEIYKLYPEVFSIIESWFKSISNSSLLSFSDYRVSTAFYQFKKSIEHANLNKGEFFYDLETYGKKSGYTIAFGVTNTQGSDYKSEILLKDGKVISNYFHKLGSNVVYKYNNFTMITDLLTDFTFTLPMLDEVLKVSKNYIVGIIQSSKDNYARDYESSEDFSYAVYSKSDNKVIYKGSRKYSPDDKHSFYKLINDRYFCEKSISNGIYDLKTQKLIANPFANGCTNFICNITNTEYTDFSGVHHVQELPNLSWTGYSTKEFLSKFNGFVPKPRTIGHLNLDGTGVFTSYREDVLAFKGLESGIFYYTNNSEDEICNILSNSVYKIDSIMKSWILKQPGFILLDKKPENPKYFSVYKALKNGKSVLGLELRQCRLKYKDKDLETNFLKSRVLFDAFNIIDVSYIINSYSVESGLKGKVEIKCKISGKTITFESNMSYNVFEVSNIE